MTKVKKWMILLVGLPLLFTGCGGTEEVESVPADEVPVVSQETDKVVAEAVIEPDRWSELRFEGGGTIAEVLVEEGDKVSEGDLLVRLDPTDAELAVRQAEAALASAEAELARVQAGPRLEAIAVAEAQLAAAETAISQSEAQRDELTTGTTATEIAAAQAQVVLAERDRWVANEQHQATLRCYEIPRGRGGWKRICPGEDFEEDARYALGAANDALAAAQSQLAAVRGGSSARLRTAEMRVSSALAQRDVSQAELDLRRLGATQEQIGVAEAAVQQAEAALTTAKATLERIEIRAPFAGTVTKLNVDVGETASPGAVIVVLATLDHLLARTVDLTELDVARVTEGQVAVVTADALPNLELRGRVARIGLRSIDYRGDVTYPVYVELDEDVPELRWGMTAMVEIEG